jgi:hypothetical protein
VIFPVPVTLNLFLALEFVFTFGIFMLGLMLHPDGGTATEQYTYGAGWAISLLKERKGIIKSIIRKMITLPSCPYSA